MPSVKTKDLAGSPYHSYVIGAQDAPTLGIKTLTGREVARDELQVP